MRRDEAYRHVEEATGKMSSIVYGISFSIIGVLFLKSRTIGLSGLQFYVFCTAAAALILNFIPYLYQYFIIDRQLDKTYKNGKGDSDIPGFVEKHDCILKSIYLSKIAVLFIAIAMFIYLVATY